MNCLETVSIDAGPGQGVAIARCHLPHGHQLATHESGPHSLTPDARPLTLRWTSPLPPPALSNELQREIREAGELAARQVMAAADERARELRMAALRGAQFGAAVIGWCSIVAAIGRRLRRNQYKY